MKKNKPPIKNAPYANLKKKPQKSRKSYYTAGAVLAGVLLAAALWFFLTPPDGYYADINIKDYGTITAYLDRKAAPITVKNFVSLAKDGFYDGLTFHRIIDGFMMQGGDPNGDGSGGSPKTIYGEFFFNGYDNPISHTRGTISMARADPYNSASSQFFIMQDDKSSSLDGLYAGFGHVVSGMDIVDQICTDAKPTDDNGLIPAAEQPVITSITIRNAE